MGGGGDALDEVVGFGHGGSRSTRLGIQSYGSKAARLAAMASCGLQVPPSLALPISACNQSLNHDGDVSVSFQVDISRGVRGLQRTTRKWLGDKDDPLILAVRLSPVKAQGGLGLPVISVGWSEEAIDRLESDAERENAAKDLAATVRELSSQIFNVDEFLFDKILEEAEAEGPVIWRDVLENYVKIAVSETQGEFPIAPSDQLILAVKAVWQAWYKPRAQTYRQLYDIDDAGGIGVLIQVAVPWQKMEQIATGWITVRNETTGESVVSGEVYYNTETQPQDLADIKRKSVIRQLVKQAHLWEIKSARAERLDFIIADDKVFIIDGTPQPLSTAADVTFAVAMVKADAITKEDAVQRIDPARLIDMLHARLDSKEKPKALAFGLPASPGAASGRLVFSAGAAEALKSKGWEVILLRPETSPEDIRGMQAAAAIVTTKGGLTSHAAVIARGTGKPCIVSMGGVKLDSESKQIIIEGETFHEGDHLTVDGSSGTIHGGKLSLKAAEVSGDLSTLLEWADEFRRMTVFTNVESPKDAELALQFGAEGIGLCRTEHMLFEERRLNAMRRVIMGGNREVRDRAINELLPLLREDFINLFDVMRDRPVTIRLFDPPLHEFLPKAPSDIAALARDLDLDPGELAFDIDELAETNPMLGNRGCRLLIGKPELAKNTRAGDL